MTLAEKLSEVGNNRPKLYKKGALDYSPQETVSGEAIGIKDISPIEHNMAVSVRGKNVINFFDINALQYIKYHSSSGTEITIKGYSLTNLEVGKSYTISFAFKDSTNITEYLYFTTLQKSTRKALGTKYLVTNINEPIHSPYTFTVEDDREYMLYRGGSYTITQSEIDKFSTFQLEEGTTPASYTPYIEDISTVKLYKCGKNLVDIPDFTFSSSAVHKNLDVNLLKGKTVTLSALLDATEAETQTFNLRLDYIVNGATTHNSTNAVSASNKVIVKVTVKIPENAEKVQLIKQVGSSSKIGSAKVTEIMIEFGSPTEHEPYIEPTVYDVSADGTVEGVKSLYPSTTLYTDTNGAVIDCTYYQDGKKVKENLIDMILSLGGVINE